MEAKDSQAIAGNAADKVARVGKVDKVNKVDRNGRVDSVSKVLKVSNDNHAQHPKHGWEVKPFEDCILKVKYPTKIPSSHYLKEGVYPIVSQEDELISGYWNNINDIFKVTSPVVIFGDHTRIIKYVDFDFVLGADGVKILQPIKDIKAKFLKLYLEYSKIPSLGYSRHYKLLKEISLPIPPMEEQERIVAELDCLSGVIEKKRQQLKEYDALAQSIFYDMFGDPISNEKGWKVDKLGDICDVRDGTHDSPKYLEQSEYLLITSKNITADGNIDFTTANYISKQDYDAINKRSCVDKGDIIMAMIGTIGKPIIVKNVDKMFSIKNVALVKFCSSTNVINTYIQSLLNNPSYRFHIQSQNKGGTQKFIALGTIRTLPIPCPPMELQREFADKIEAIEKQKELLKRSIKEIETLFDARMDYYFGDT